MLALQGNGMQISAMGVKVTNGEFWCFLSLATAIGAAGYCSFSAFDVVSFVYFLYFCNMKVLSRMAIDAS